MNSLSYLNQDQQSFPPPEQALSDPNGLLAVGGDLQPERLLNAYYNGIFPWFNQDDPILWWSPDPRAVFAPGNLRVSRSLIKYLKKQSWTFSINKQFPAVIRGCAAPRAKQEETWISDDIQQAYLSLHQQGHAHSIEVWEDDILIGGLYGLAIGQVFCGESMFHLRTNASKAAMIVLQQHLLRCGFKLIDAQVENPHLDSLGAKSIKRKDFLTLLKHLRDGDVNPDSWLTTEVPIEL
ncbi:Leucyl/phenylalanyl-tRNA--protein transferase [Shewanella piezotolerans WP3]|uniref:Leucyl/phenylalanyl-tRNA--protein transferase n=1 Tax=Shewanella piezotolerans (strain WP3 / JCM 13877) TaxID=225849 RepID=LFTR_SHEPW|nr:leucyl/phenylalanyl-tRNA--protein transferase [Shewanella piezotolerans]B8CLI5.1 RecName: Full=Leucyl/phenylalanyl-tRNA--protein transferase; AltName: Full=L/F-transferase; AltName: Full=Leucyltransferase; AltName: Full=Phenyalanyltransferase [Shewanella piezotolerans WP3]ACJ28636.1 Leucyl/phenylalanyl-tRNA--protein transferase [Shewanella piezotolerans WP3]